MKTKREILKNACGKGGPTSIRTLPYKAPKVPKIPVVPSKKYNPNPKVSILPIPRKWGEVLPGRKYPAVEGPGNPSWERRNPKLGGEQSKLLM